MQPPAVFVTSVIKDEEDIIAAWCDHYIHLGIRNILILNGSSDDTTAILDAKCREFPDVFRIWTDHDPAHRQDLKMTRLCDIAHESGAGWILPVDGDEFWRPVQQNLAESLGGDELQVWQVKQIFHFPGSLDDPMEMNPVLRIKHHSEATTQNAKVCFRWTPGAIVEMGNHSLRHPALGRTFGQITDGLVIHHFPYRSEDQFVAKVRKGIAGLAAAAELPGEICSHWRAYGRILEANGEEGLRNWYRENIFHDTERLRELTTMHSDFFANYS
jgi:hypothetical protein